MTRMRKPESSSVRGRMFRNTARRVKAVNISPSAMRGGIRLS